MREDTRALLEEIAHCPIVVSCKSGHEHPCGRVVDLQRDASLSKHQVPEPWSGHLDEALILFVGTGPAMARGEDYAVWSDPADEVADYFDGRFGDGPRQILDGVYPPIPGRHSATPLQSWVELKARAAELVEDPVPGVDYAVTYAVHCRTQGELGLRPAMTVCPDRYLRRVVAAARRAVVLIAVGPHAGAAVREVLGVAVSDDVRHAGPVHVEGLDRHVVYLDHFGGYGSAKEVATAVTAADFGMLRRALAAQRSGGDQSEPPAAAAPARTAAAPRDPASLVRAAFEELTAAFEDGEARWLAAAGRLHDVALTRVGWLVQKSVAGQGLDVVALGEATGFALRSGRRSLLWCDYAAVPATDCRSRRGADKVLQWALQRVRRRPDGDQVLAAVAVCPPVGGSGPDGRGLDEVAAMLLPRVGLQLAVDRYRVEDASSALHPACLDVYLFGRAPTA